MNELPEKQSVFSKIRNKIIDAGLKNKFTRSIIANIAPNIFGYNLTDYVLSNDDSELSQTMELLSSMNERAVKANISQILRTVKRKIKTNSDNNDLNTDKLINMILDSVTEKASEFVIFRILREPYFIDDSFSDETCKRVSDLIDCSNKTSSEIKQMFETIESIRANKYDHIIEISYNLFESLTLEQRKEHFSQIIPIVSEFIPTFSASYFNKDNPLVLLFSEFPEEDKLEQYKKILEMYKTKDNKGIKKLESLSICFNMLSEEERQSTLDETFEQIRNSDKENEKLNNAIRVISNIPAQAQEKYYKEVLGYNIQYLYQLNMYISILDKSLRKQILFDVINKARQITQISNNYNNNDMLEIIDNFESDISSAFVTILNGDVDNPNAKFILYLLNQEGIIENIEKEITNQQGIEYSQIIAFQQKGYNIDGLAILYTNLECNRILNNCMENPNQKQYKESIKEISEVAKDIELSDDKLYLYYGNNKKYEIILEKKLDTYIQLLSNIKSEERKELFSDILTEMERIPNINIEIFRKKANELFGLLEKEAQISQFPVFINWMMKNFAYKRDVSKSIEKLIESIDSETMSLIYSKYIEMFNKGGKENYLNARSVLVSDKFLDGLNKKLSKEDCTLLTEKELENILSNKYSMSDIPHEYYNIVKIFAISRVEKIKNKYNNLDENEKKQNVDLVLAELSKEIGVIAKFDGYYDIISQLHVNAINEIFVSFDNEEKSKHFDVLFKSFDENIKNEDIRNKSFITFFEQLDNDTQIEIFKHCTSLSFENLKYAAEILSNFSIKELNKIFKGKITLDEEIISKLMELKDSITIKTLLFDKDIDREKLIDLSSYDQLQTNIINIDSIIQSLYLNNKGADKEKFNQLLDDTYNLFTYNNIPEFMKNFRMFQLGNFYHKENSKLQSFQGKSFEERDALILEDLFKIALDSNSESLRDFLNIIIEGNKLTNLLQENPEEQIKSFSVEELALLNQYRDTLIDFHNFIKEIKKTDKPKIEKTDDIIKDLRTLSYIYSSNQDNIFDTDKIINELFKGFITIEITPEKLLEYMDNKKAESDARHLEIEKKLREGTLHLEEGDFIKGIKYFDSYISSMMHDGIKGGEFNKEHSHSDATPLDLDFGYISKENLKKEKATDYEIICTTISEAYGSNYIVLKQYADRLHAKSSEKIFGEEIFTSFSDYYGLGSGENSTNNSRYIRTGIPITDVDYIVSEAWNFKNGYEMAMAGIYIPVINTKGEIVFSSEDYKKIREEMRGLSHYHADNIQVSQEARNVEALYSIYKSVSIKDIEEIDKEIETVNRLVEGNPDTVTEEKKKAIIKLIKDYFNTQGIKVSDDLSQNLSSTSIELIDTGSTGRATNVPGDGDFDFMLRHNLPSDELVKFSEYVKQLKHSSFTEVVDGFRAKDVTLPTGEVVDLDITTAKKSLELSYSSDMCVRDRLNNIKENNPESYNYVKANIIMAKKILKAKGIYKKIGSNGATEYGGFGGIGVENWILQNGGSFKKAIDTFLEVANQVSSYEEFKEKYPIFDFGFNHREGKTSHDCFSSFLASNINNPDKGFEYVKKELTEIQKALELEIEKQDLETPLLKSISTEGLIEASKKKSILRNKFSYSKIRSMMAKYMSVKESSKVQLNETQTCLEGN